MTISSDTGIWEIGSNWPWPQVRFTSRYVLAMAVKADDNIALYELENVDNVWTATEKVVVGAIGNVLAWNVADFGDYYFVSVDSKILGVDDRAVYARDVSTGTVTIKVATYPRASCACNFRGQLLLGGIKSSTAPWSYLSECSVCWGDIGSVEMGPENYTVAGFAQMPWNDAGNGKVYAVLSLDATPVVYGNKGFVQLQPFAMETVTGFGVSKILGPGVLSGDAIDGDENIHGFVDTDYNWWIVTREGPKKLGYKKFMETLTGRILVRYERLRERFYISDGILCYVFNKSGMYSTHQCVSGIGEYNGIICGFAKANADTKIRLGTSAANFGIQDLKTVESWEAQVEYETTGVEDIYGAVSVKYDYKADFTDLPFIVLNERGIVTQKATGRAFRLRLQADYEAGAEFAFGGITAKVKQSDKRNTRGRLDVS